MKLFGQLVRVAVGVVRLPKDLVQDALDISVGEHPTHTKDRLDEIKEDAKEDTNGK